MAAFGPVPSHGQAKDLVVNQGLRPFEFSGELNLECRHFCEYVPNARISRSARRFGAVQRAYPAIQRVGHPGLALSRSAWECAFYQQATSRVSGGNVPPRGAGAGRIGRGGTDWIKVKNPDAPTAARLLE